MALEKKLSYKKIVIGRRINKRAGLPLEKNIEAYPKISVFLMLESIKQNK
jgi:hypothetical protein